MITKKELQDYARINGLSLGNAEKDYLLDIALLSISRNTKNELVFKGGTCLYKFHGLNRFSEDLDFSAVKKINTDKLISVIISDFEKFGVKVILYKNRKQDKSILITLRTEGPLFSGNPATYSNIGIDINLKSSVELDPEFIAYNPSYPDIPKISFLCMKQEEIFAEKIRALMTRERARDLFDLRFMMEKKVYANVKIIDNKLRYYNKEFNLNKLILKIRSLEKNWKKELSSFTSIIPDFNVISKDIVKELKKRYGK